MPGGVLIMGGQPGLMAALAARQAGAGTRWRAAEPGREVDAVWWLPAGNQRLDEPAQQRLLAVEAGVFNVVVPYGPSVPLIAACAARGVPWRLFHVPPVIDPAAAAPSGVPRLLSALATVASEVRRRRADYFQHHPLLVRLPPHATAPVVAADQVAAALHELAGAAGTVDCRYRLAVDTPSRLADVCQRLGQVWDLSIEFIDDPTRLGPVDRYLADLLGDTGELLAAPATDGARVCRLADMEPDRQAAWFSEVGAAHHTAHDRARRRADALPDMLERRGVDLGGVRLGYAAGGSGGPPLVVLNALGQGLGYWYPLMDRLLRHHRILIWETRADTATGTFCTLADHVEDVAAVLRQEDVAECHLLGWCTGAKVAIEFYRRFPAAVRSMLLLNGAFKHPTRPATLDSAYERDLEAMCRALDRRPERAGALRGLFGPTASAPTGPAAAPDRDVLALTDPSLQAEVGRPFADETTIVRYARQHLEFWSHDVTTHGNAVRVPVLFVAGEYDRVVSPAGVREAAKRFPTGRFTLLPGATHYRMFDRADLVADLVEDFLREPLQVGSPAR